MKHIKYIPVILFLISSSVLPAQTPEELESWLPVTEGWTLAGEREVFNPDNLFDRINGAAPLYIENNFREMTSLEYKKGDYYITVQAYRHATPEDAFGMYASERSSDMQFVPVGGEAQSGPRFFYFFAGNMYVKMQTNSEDESETLTAIAKGLAEKIDPRADYPAILKLFPEKGKIPRSEAYVTAGFIGHDFLKSVYVCKYENEGQTFRLFVIDGKTETGAVDILGKYLSFTGQKEEQIKDRITIKDRYNGNMPILWKSQYIVGVFNENGETVKDADVWIDELSERL